MSMLGVTVYQTGRYALSSAGNGARMVLTRMADGASVGFQGEDCDEWLSFLDWERDAALTHARAFEIFDGAASEYDHIMIGVGL